jgi:glycosidase
VCRSAAAQTWDEKAGQYYWHRFYSSQPDLKYDVSITPEWRWSVGSDRSDPTALCVVWLRSFENPKVQQEMFDVMKFWLDIGVDGFRVDAVPYLCTLPSLAHQT